MIADGGGPRERRRREPGRCADAGLSPADADGPQEGRRGSAQEANGEWKQEQGVKGHLGHRGDHPENTDLLNTVKIRGRGGIEGIGQRQPPDHSRSQVNH